MALHINNRQEIPTDIALEAVLPIFQEWFDLSHTNHVLQDVEIEQFGKGGSAVKITLGKFVSNEQIEELREALRAQGTDLA